MDGPNPYNAIRYSTLPQQRTHPARLGAVGALMGMTPAPVANCRVLEIGCGTGGNLIAMALALPASRFVGLDLAESAVDVARQDAGALGLENLTLHAADLCEIGPDFGEFDYMIAHGVYSWVPAEVRDRLMAICR